MLNRKLGSERSSLRFGRPLYPGSIPSCATNLHPPSIAARFSLKVSLHPSHHQPSLLLSISLSSSQPSHSLLYATSASPLIVNSLLSPSSRYFRSAFCSFSSSRYTLSRQARLRLPHRARHSIHHGQPITRRTSLRCLRPPPKAPHHPHHRQRDHLWHPPRLKTRRKPPRACFGSSERLKWARV